MEYVIPWPCAHRKPVMQLHQLGQQIKACIMKIARRNKQPTTHTHIYTQPVLQYDGSNFRLAAHHGNIERSMDNEERYLPVLRLCPEANASCPKLRPEPAVCNSLARMVPVQNSVWQQPMNSPSTNTAIQIKHVLGCFCLDHRSSMEYVTAWTCVLHKPPSA